MAESINEFKGTDPFLKDFTRGQTRNVIVSITKDGSPVDITGSKFYMKFTKQLGIDEPAELEIVVDTPTDPTNGKTLILLTDTQTQALLGTYYVSLRWVNNFGATKLIGLQKMKILEGNSSRID